VNDVCKSVSLEKETNVRDLSVESLALMMSLANVCAGCRYLVIDETGLLTAAILERGSDFEDPSDFRRLCVRTL
jgi:hypothetical protein